MNAEIDMSGRIEESTKPTILALSNKIKLSIKISSRYKQTLFNKTKRIYPQLSYTLIRVYMFSSFVNELIIASKLEINSVIFIDTEYSGYEAIIKDRINGHLQKHHIPPDFYSIRFKQVGKNSPAHHLAIGVLRKDIKPTIFHK
ncbi:MAG: hypothetical protein G01um101416_1188 [Microgenomates group bacterium Gr01-1014_16]|nr:MAG: hypothetical protein G01um101416_1188 [Microgenomates group bacterium Gr01-1014_16]